MTPHPDRDPAAAEPPARPRLGLTEFGQIDLCRGLFAVLVVLCHAFTAAWALDPDAPATISPAAYDWLLDSVGLGYYWVMGFFVLSGYCIHRSVDRQITSGRFDARAYLIARATRILPLYYLAFLFALGMQALASTVRTGASDALADPGVVWAQVFVVQNLVRCYPNFVASWSITNESFYYLLYGLLVARLAGRRGRPAWVGLGLCVAVGLAFQGVYLLGHRENWVLRVGLLFGLGIVWFLGVLVAVERDRLRASAPIQALARGWPLALLGAVVGIHRGLPLQVAYLASGVAFAGLLVRMTASARSETPVREPGWATATVGFLGLMSYPTYLFHAPWQSLCSHLLPRLGWQADWRVTWLALTASSLALGAVLAVAAERPIMRWRGDLLARLRSRPRPSRQPAPAGRPLGPLGLSSFRRITGS